MNKHTEKLISKGRFGDTILAHINPSEALLLKLAGGSGTINPKTGLPEFFSLGDIWGGISDTVSAPFQWTGDILSNVTGSGDIEKFTDNMKGRNDSGLAGMLDTVADPGGFIDYTFREGVGPNLPDWMKNIMPQVGSLVGGVAGGVYGGPMGAAAGAAGGRTIGGKFAGESYTDTMQGALPAAALAYGGGKLLQGAGAGGDSSIMPLSPAGQAGAEAGKEAAAWLGSDAIGGAAGALPDTAIGTGGTDTSQPIWAQAANISPNALEAGMDVGGTAGISEGGISQPSGWLSNVGDKISNLFSSSTAASGGAGTGSVGAKTGGVMDMIGNNKLMLALAGSGILSSALTGQENAGIAEDNRNALAQAINQESWNTQSRENVGKAIDAENSNSIAALLKRTGGAAAESGRGGGFYGNAAERGAQAARENKAKFISSTFAPNTNLIPYLAQSMGSSPSATSGITSGIGQTAGNILPYLLAMNMMGK